MDFGQRVIWGQWLSSKCWVGVFIEVLDIWNCAQGCVAMRRDFRYVNDEQRVVWCTTCVRKGFLGFSHIFTHIGLFVTCQIITCA